MGGEGDQNPRSLRAKMTKFQTQTKPQLLEGSDSAKEQNPWATMAVSHISSISVGSSRAAINWEEETPCLPCSMSPVELCSLTEDAQGFSHRWTSNCRDLLGSNLAHLQCGNRCKSALP